MEKLLLICLWLASSWGYAEDVQTLVLQHENVQNTLKVEVVDEEAERAAGLMHRTTLCGDCGMLFVYPEWVGKVPPQFGMWMRNTLIPLDMLFLKDGVVIGIHEGAKPHDETVIMAPDGTNGVLEVNGGWVAANRVQLGWRAHLKDAP